MKVVDAEPHRLSVLSTQWNWTSPNLLSGGETLDVYVKNRYICISKHIMYNICIIHYIP